MTSDRASLRTRLRRAFLAAACLAAALAMSSCGGDKKTTPPPPVDQPTTITVGSDSSSATVKSVKVKIPEGLLAPGSQLSIGVSDQTAYSPPPSFVIVSSPYVQVTFDQDDVASVPDSLVARKTLRFAVPAAGATEPYLRMNLALPGQSPTVVYERIPPEWVGQDSVRFTVPLAYLERLAANPGSIAFEAAVASPPAGKAKAQAMELWAAALDPATQKPRLTKVQGRIPALGGKRVLVLVHGWGWTESEWEFRGQPEIKLRRYWEKSLETLLPNLSADFQVYCLFYDEDESLANLDGEMESAFSTWFDYAQTGKIFIVAHSMGGLLTRGWNHSRTGPSVLGGAVLIDTPNHGSALGNAWFDRLPLIVPASLLLGESGTANLTCDSSVDLPGVGSFFVNSYLDDLNAGERDWSKYALVCGDCPTPFTALDEVGFNLCLVAFYIEHWRNVASDGIVETTSQMPPEVLSLAYPSTKSHLSVHTKAPQNPDVLDFVTRTLRAMKTGSLNPAPAFVSGVTLSSTQLDLGQSLIVSATVRNGGAACTYGGISVGFPDLADPTDVTRVSSNSSGDTPGHQPIAKNQTLYDRSCVPHAADYLLAEYGDNNWLADEENTYTLAVTPKAVGTFRIYVRAALRIGSDPQACQWATALPSNGAAGSTDQQGWEVKRFDVNVTTGVDNTPPSRVTNLAAVEPQATSVTLTWTAPGDDGIFGAATAYEIRRSANQINDANWTNATIVANSLVPSAYGSPQGFQVTGLSSGQRYYFALKARDEASPPNWSPLSNVVSVTTLTGDTTPPSRVTDLAAGSPTSTTLTLTWTAPGDDGIFGTATAYEIRRSGATITDANWTAATLISNSLTPGPYGSPQALTVTGLTASQGYYFALKARDEASLPNWSPVSNVASGTTTGSGPIEPGFVLIPAGTFTMGSPANEPGRLSNETQHQVTLTKSFLMCDHEVTQAEWFAVMNTRPSRFAGDSLPVEQVTWLDCVDYCNARSVRESLEPVYTRNGSTVTWDQAKNGYRLPTEAEWEYACRATTTLAFCNGGITNIECSPVDPNLNQVGWYCGNASSTTHAVGGKAANTWGLKDVHGNVWEWCWDWYGAYGGDIADPTGPASGSFRVLRGGSWGSYAQTCRSAVRGGYIPDTRYNYLGLRLSRTAP